MRSSIALVASPRITLVAALAAIVLGSAMIVPAAMANLRENTAATGAVPPQAPAPAASPSTAAERPIAPPAPLLPTLKAARVSLTVDGFWSWALLDRESGRISGSRNITATNSTESMVKIWLVSDYLRRTAAAGNKPTQTRLRQATVAIRDSNDQAAQALYNAGGRNAVIRRMISTCDLTDTSVFSGWWSRTQISARDAVRLGLCVADGRAAGPQWTRWVLTEMTKVRGTTESADQPFGGRWGIIDGLPKEILKQGVSIKNGWTPIGADGRWHLNCLAVAKDWILAVLMRYPVRYGLDYGADACARVAKQLVTKPTPQTG